MERHGDSRGRVISKGLSQKKTETNSVPDEHKPLTEDSQDFVVGEMIGSRIFQTRNLQNPINL